MDDEEIRKIAHRKWEEEGRPEGAQERHWREAEDENWRSAGTPQTMLSDHYSGVSPPSGERQDQEVDEPSNDWPAANEDAPGGEVPRE
jgi:hypothetical protein